MGFMNIIGILELYIFCSFLMSLAFFQYCLIDWLISYCHHLKIVLFLLQFNFQTICHCLFLICELFIYYQLTYNVIFFCMVTYIFFISHYLVYSVLLLLLFIFSLLLSILIIIGIHYYHHAGSLYYHVK